MLSYHLENAVKDLKDLIKITESDMQDIKVAQHDPQFATEKVIELSGNHRARVRK